MTDKEINEAIARKLGWTHGKGKRFDNVWISPDKSTEVETMGSFPICDFCHSIAAAWEVVEFIKPKGLGLCSHMMPPYGWSCSIWTPMTEEPDFTIRADTAPMAICLAFLKLP